MALANNPIDQFNISKLVPIEVAGIDISFTNSSLFMIIVVALSSVFFGLASSGRGLIPGRMQSIAEICYEFVSSLLRESAGSEGMRFFPFVFSLFVFILGCNMLGMFPYFFTVTSHIIVTFALAAMVITTVMFYGFWKNGFRFLNLFLPKGLPPFIIPFIFVLEIISFLVRPVSLSMRLFANMLAGHIVLKVFAGFVVMLSGLGFAGLMGAVVPLVFTVALTALEFLVAFLQAYIFTILTCMYLNDAINPSH